MIQDLRRFIAALNRINLKRRKTHIHKYAYMQAHTNCRSKFVHIVPTNRSMLKYQALIIHKRWEIEKDAAQMFRL
uniref:Uncharacterized protein n=1 Tax=Nelumbo nucifera TaxID=4432 RepID=A0A822ZN05_NELNU|nr:TPA_asm: hypothetical protein HUJ06_002556 [Nelumbo nucifera]